MYFYPLPSFLELFRLFYALITCTDYVWGKYFLNLAKQYTPETKWPPLSPVTGGRNLWIMGGEIYRVPEKYTPLLVQSSI